MPLKAETANIPKVSIEEAIAKGRAHVASKDPQLRVCFITKVEYQDANEASDRHWSIFWSGEKPPVGKKAPACFAELRVFENGTVLRVVGY